MIRQFLKKKEMFQFVIEFFVFIARLVARVGRLAGKTEPGFSGLSDKSSDLSDSHKKSHVKHSEKTVTQKSSHSNPHGPTEPGEKVSNLF